MSGTRVGPRGRSGLDKLRKRVGIRTARGEGEADAAGDSSLCHSQARVEGGIVDVLVAATYALSAPGAGLAGGAPAAQRATRDSPGGWLLGFKNWDKPMWHNSNTIPNSCHQALFRPGLW